MIDAGWSDKILRSSVSLATALTLSLPMRTRVSATLISSGCHTALCVMLKILLVWRRSDRECASFFSPGGSRVSHALRSDWEIEKVLAALGRERTLR